MSFAPRHRILPVAAAILLGVPAAADWAYLPDQGPSGQAMAPGEAGTTLTVDCDETGHPALFVDPSPIPSGADQPGVAAPVTLDVDGAALSAPMTCYEAGPCWIDPPPEEVAALAERLRQGLVLRLVRDGETLDSYSLRGSAAALTGLREAGCRTL